MKMKVKGFLVLVYLLWNPVSDVKFNNFSSHLLCVSLTWNKGQSKGKVSFASASNAIESVQLLNRMNMPPPPYCELEKPLSWDKQFNGRKGRSVEKVTAWMLRLLILIILKCQLRAAVCFLFNSLVISTDQINKAAANIRSCQNDIVANLLSTCLSFFVCICS